MNLSDIFFFHISTDRLQPEETLSVEVTCKGDASAFSSVWVKLTYRGETVCENACDRDGNRPLTIELTPPFNAPQGRYEVRIGVDSKTEYTVAGEVQIGESKTAEPLSVRLSHAVIPSFIRKGEPFSVSVQAAFSSEIGFDTAPYLALWKGGLLFEVLEGKNIRAEENKIVFSAELTGDLPEGDYAATVGIHTVHADTTCRNTISVEGTDPAESRYRKPMSHGYYLAQSSGKEHFWYVNPYGAMIWDGAPYVPFGGMFVSKYLREYDIGNPEKNKANFLQDKADLDEIRAAGIRDLYVGGNIMLVTPIWAYRYFLDYLEKTGWNYGIQADTRKSRRASVCYPRATGFCERFMVENVTQSGRVSITVDSKFARFFDYPKNAVFAVVDQQTGEMVQSGIQEITQNEDGKLVLSAKAELPNSRPHAVYFTPEIYQDLKFAANYWDEPEKTYGFIDTVFGRLETGDHFRFIVDLINNESGFYNDLETGRFSDESFNRIFSDWLKEKYRSAEALNESWKTEPALSGFAEASELIPVYTPDQKEGKYSFFVSIKTGKGYRVDVKNGLAWNDYLDARDERYLAFMNRATDRAKKHLNVPYIYKHVSVQRKYFVNKDISGGFDGLGSEAYESVGVIANQFAVTAAQNDQFARTAWNVVTETNNHENVMNKYRSGQWSYESKEDMFLRFNTALERGMKGIFDFLLADRSDESGKLGMAYSWIINKQVIGWASEYKKNVLDPSVSGLIGKKYETPVFCFFPPNKNWWFKCNERSIVERMDDCIPFKRLKTASGNHVAPTEDLSVNTKLLFLNLRDKPYSLVYGKTVSKYLNEKKDGKRICVLGHRNDLGTIPEIDRYYTAEKVPIDNGKEVVQVLKPSKTSEILKTTEDGKPWALKDGDLYIVATDSPGISNGEFETLRYVDELGITKFEDE